MGHCRKPDKFWLGKELTLQTFTFPCPWPCRVEETSSRESEATLSPVNTWMGDRLGTLGAVCFYFSPPLKERYSCF